MGAIGVAWSIIDGDVHLPARDAEWWGAALSVLVAAVHHPHPLADQQPDTDPAETARDVLDELDTLRAALDVAEAAGRTDHDRPASLVVTGRAGIAGRVVVISPATELRHLVWLLETFACAVADPDGAPEQRRAAGETTNGHLGSAWSRDLGIAAGASR